MHFTPLDADFGTRIRRGGPYAETGPVFLCADPCTAWSDDGVPPILTTSPDYLVKGYTADDRILYGTGAIVPAADPAREVALRLKIPAIAYVDVRSARNNCFQTRALRDDESGMLSDNKRLQWNYREKVALIPAISCS